MADHFQQFKTSCPAGHEYTSANTYQTQDGRRACRACNADRARARRRAGLVTSRYSPRLRVAVAITAGAIDDLWEKHPDKTRHEIESMLRLKAAAR